MFHKKFIQSLDFYRYVCIRYIWNYSYNLKQGDYRSMKLNYAPSIRRLPSYLHIIRAFQRTGEPYISGTWIANELNLEPIQVRKDLAITGIVGKPKKGYPVEQLIAAIEHYLAWDVEQKAMIVGAGNLGSALNRLSGVYKSWPPHCGRLRQRSLESGAFHPSNTGLWDGRAQRSHRKKEHHIGDSHCTITLCPIEL